ncbi:MBL fold metallo-hydrolase [Paenibacillus melissococcoides]|uniref:MBL fold metallo-hydrolase n=1 Tax=Paenibacillus melissococcoides TaxID=2912268 RepID=A0ABN8U8G8_9BACL|nr:MULTISPECIES: MBL fold metallo-hydrolase [Paenibacillus]MEB9893242.1 MBL fold metallo-hydrolase [Bacillus cereus]CAH8246085.1 MBL fold metallo-hydrolase [Paenibacillus melissococcoides]CAH8712931.1 MBL fold metallo-hydrolase [Paenibacillus melissococcoides]CAH8713679.1 MBL fold metallo-hydrolase [Paenibacillus melissococcoides]GIO78715.1 metallo-hydrolase [Paenibacillus dendritiformis]
MIQVKVLASGSSGNCIWLGNGEVNILVDVGLPKTKIEKIMLQQGIDPTKIEAIFITHEHGDHIKGIALAEKYKIPVHASAGTLKGIGDVETASPMRPDALIMFNAFDDSIMRVRPFAVSHDAYEPFGFTVQDKDTKVSIMMDTGTVTGQMLKAMEDSDIYVFECNHDVDMLTNGEYPEITKSRILSDTGHLSNQAAAAALARLLRGKGEHIYLTHMSSSNNMPALAEMTVKRALRAKGLKAGEHYYLHVV